MLKLENISFEVENEKEILRDVNLTIEKGKFIAITGPNWWGQINAGSNYFWRIKAHQR